MANSFVINAENSANLVKTFLPFSQEKDAVFNMVISKEKKVARCQIVNPNNYLLAKADIDNVNFEEDMISINLPAKSFFANLQAVNQFETPIEVIVEDSLIQIKTSNVKVSVSKSATEGKQPISHDKKACKVAVRVNGSVFADALVKGSILAGGKNTSTANACLSFFFEGDEAMTCRIYSTDGAAVCYSKFRFTEYDKASEIAKSNRGGDEFRVGIPSSLIASLREYLSLPTSENCIIYVDDKNMSLITPCSSLTVALASPIGLFKKTIEGSWDKLSNTCNATIESVQIEKAFNILSIGEDTPSATIQFDEKELRLANSKSVVLKPENIEGEGSLRVAIQKVTILMRGEKSVTLSIVETENGGNILPLFKIVTEGRVSYLMPMKEAAAEKKEEKKADKPTPASKEESTVKEESTSEETVAEAVDSEEVEETPFDE